MNSLDHVNADFNPVLPDERFDMQPRKSHQPKFQSEAIFLIKML